MPLTVSCTYHHRTHERRIRSCVVANAILVVIVVPIVIAISTTTATITAKEAATATETAETLGFYPP